jgi:transposase
MLTGMSEADWAVTLEVVRGCCSRRGDKGRDGRLLLEALRCFAVHNVTWRALPAGFGTWNSVWGRLWRLGRSGVLEAFFDALASLSATAHLVRVSASTVLRARVSAAGAQGGRTVRRSAARAAGSRPRSTSRPTSPAGPLLSL